MIAGIIQGNVRQSPYREPRGGAAAAQLRARAHGRRRASSPREAADAPRRSRSSSRGEPTGDGSPAPYFLEEVRKYLEAKYGAKALYESGLTVRTPLDSTLQQAANRARRSRPAPGRQAPRHLPQAARNVARREAHRSTRFQHDRWTAPHRRGRHRPRRGHGGRATRTAARADGRAHRRADTSRRFSGPARRRRRRSRQGRRPDRGRAHQDRRRGRHARP